MCVCTGQQSASSAGPNPTKMTPSKTVRPKDKDNTDHNTEEANNDSEVILLIVIGVLAFIVIVIVLAVVLEHYVLFCRKKADGRTIADALQIRFRPGIGGLGKDLMVRY